MLQRQATPIIAPELVAQVAKGNRHAFSQLYDLSNSLLFTLAKKILVETDATAELLQEVYIEIWQKAHKYDPDRGSPLSWMVTLTRSRAIDRLRSRGWKSRRIAGSLENSTGVALEADNPTPLESYAQQELREKVGSALSVLPKEQRQALQLAYYEGMSQAEIAARLQEPLGTIKTRIRLAVLKLRGSLRSCWTQE